MVRAAIPLWLAAFVMTSHAGETAGQLRALELADATLKRLLAAEAILEEALERRDFEMFRTKFEQPLKQLVGRWNRSVTRSRGMTDREVASHMTCASAADMLLQYGQALFRPDAKFPNWGDYTLRRYREDLADCKDSVRNPQRYRED